MSPTTRAIWLMIASMAGFAMADLMIKKAGVLVPPGQVIVIISAGGLVVFSLLAGARGQALFSRDLLARPVLVRNFAEAASALLFISGLVITPLAAFSAVTQVTPILVTLGAIVFLKMAVGWRRWGAILVGLTGVLVIIRPGASDFEPGALLALAAAATMAARDLATRLVPEHIRSAQLAAWGNGAILPAGLLLLALSGGPVAMSGSDTLALSGAILFGSAGYFALTAALRQGDVATIIPYRYTRLVFALALSVIFLGERPDTATLAGAAIVVAAGLYSLIREARMQARR